MKKRSVLSYQMSQINIRIQKSQKQLIMRVSFEQISQEIEDAIGTRPEKRMSDTTQQALPHDDSDEDERKIALPSRYPFGNMVVFKERGPHISLGPDWCCFMAAFIMFSVVTYFVVVLVFTSTHNFTFRLVTILICVGQPLAYLLTACTNPGVVQKPCLQSEQRIRACSKCKMNVPRHARHCVDCGVCVSNYDHHCPWTSKCIGGGNIIQFYVFLGMTPVYMLYIAIAFVVCMSNNLTNIQQLPKKML